MIMKLQMGVFTYTNSGNSRRSLLEKISFSHQLVATGTRSEHFHGL